MKITIGVRPDRHMTGKQRLLQSQEAIRYLQSVGNLNKKPFFEDGYGYRETTDASFHLVVYNRLLGEDNSPLIQEIRDTMSDILKDSDWGWVSTW